MRLSYAFSILVVAVGLAAASDVSAAPVSGITTTTTTNAFSREHDSREKTRELADDTAAASEERGRGGGGGVSARFCIDGFKGYIASSSVKNNNNKKLFIPSL
ncbi:hypothetical protein L915_02335 [Phytophthora nicotianae]|uniref:RxLR effector protein n=1 Tax=Phytophthora nicotianae TaxID=4792 RepID=W2HJJ0_PHYNI|nr:hypothetical protein L915_02335 [Phytophthora nicotianae]ETL48050.1 hypothetical protein L916_02293 [Phytophthora nicotianae]